LGYHLHQHEPAFKEMEDRRQSQPHCSGGFTSEKFNMMAQSNGREHSAWYEYKCPNTKYLVSSIATVEMGDGIQMGALSTFLAGITMNRMVVEEYMELVAQQHNKYHGTNSSPTISDLVLSSKSSNMMVPCHQ
jgi:hypothetical protein